jgi:hypothetical protein
MPDDERYRAAPVRVQRVHVENVRRGELATAAEHVRDAQATLAELRARSDAARARLAVAQRAVEEAPQAVRRVFAERFAARCRRLLAAATDAVAEGEETLADRTTTTDVARRALLRARREREIIERHFARWREAKRKLVERRAD